MTKTKEQLEEEKKISLSIRIKPIDVDSLGIYFRVSSRYEFQAFWASYLKYILVRDIKKVKVPVHIEDFTRARINESDLTAVLVETGAMPVPTKSQNPTACG